MALKTPSMSPATKRGKLTRSTRFAIASAPCCAATRRTARNACQPSHRPDRGCRPSAWPSGVGPETRDRRWSRCAIFAADDVVDRVDGVVRDRVALLRRQLTEGGALQQPVAHLGPDQRQQLGRAIPVVHGDASIGPRHLVAGPSSSRRRCRRGGRAAAPGTPGIAGKAGSAGAGSAGCGAAAAGAMPAAVLSRIWFTCRASIIFSIGK